MANNQQQTDGIITQLPVANQERRRLPRRVVKLTLPEPYQDFSITAWLNFPWELRQDIYSGDEARARAAWTQIITDHDLVDFDGEPYPPAGTDAFYDAVPQEIMMVMSQVVQANVGRLTPTNAAR